MEKKDTLISKKNLLNDLNNGKKCLQCVIDIPQKASLQDAIEIAISGYRKLLFDCINNQYEYGPINRRFDEILDMLETSDVGGHMPREFWKDWLSGKVD